MENEKELTPENEPSVNEETENQQPEISPEERKIIIEKLRMEQNLPMGILAGAIAALVGALLWAVITVATGYQIGYMAVGIGFLVGFAVRFAGKGVEPVFGVVGAILALLGCLAGNFLSMVGFFAHSENLGYWEVLCSVDWGAVPSIMAETFSAMDLLFYAIALYEGFRFSFHKLQ